MPKKKEENTAASIGCLVIIGIVALAVYSPQVLVGGLILIGVIFVIYLLAKIVPPIMNKIQEEHSKIKFQESQKTFLDSPDYIFIEQFAKKYKSKAGEEDIEKLAHLLEQKQYKFSTGEIKQLLANENLKQEDIQIKNKISAMHSRNLNDYLRNYIEVCGNRKDKLHILADILQTNGIQFNADLASLQQELSRVNKQIELELFEKRLFGDDKILTIEDIDVLDGYDFERFLSDLYLRMGYTVQPTRLSGDQGADVVVIKFGEKTVIQAKRYGGTVGNKAIQEIMAAISLYKAQKGVVITNNYFTKSAVELAEANNIELIDRDGLKKLIENHWY